MGDHLHISDFSKPISLQHSFQKFWEIKLDPLTYKAVVRCGKLESNGQEDPSGIQTLEKTNSSWGEAVLYAEKHVKMKMSKGYDFYEKANTNPPKITFSLTPPNPDDFNLVSKSNNNYNNSSLSPNTTQSNSLKRKAEDVIPRDNLKQVKKNEDDDLDKDLKAIQELQKREEEEKVLGEYTQRKYKIENLQDSERSLIQHKAESLDLIFEVDAESKIYLTGYLTKIETFVEYLKKFIAARKKSPNKDTNNNNNNSSGNKNDSGRKEIPIDPQLVKYASYIEQKSLDLGLICQVEEKSVIVLGKDDKIRELEAYIKEKAQELLKTPTKTSGDSLSKKEIALTPVMKGMKADVEKKAEQLNLFIEFTDTKLIALGSAEAYGDLLTYLFELERSPAKEKFEKEDPGDFTQKEIKITKAVNEAMPEIKKKAEELDLILDMEADKFLAAGYEKKIAELMKYVEEREKAKPAVSNTSTASASGSKNEGTGDYVQKEISVSTFQRGKQAEIEKKAEELGLVCDFGYDVVLVSGYQSTIGTFIGYLYEVESEAKKALYPKYWDFHEVNAFSMANVAQGTVEYQDIVKLFHQTMQGHQVLKLERIQNKYLMDHYVTNIQKRMELRPNEAINRMLLFHGTRLTKPDIIYKNFDTGFDLQYAAHGMYGKGLYFAVGANYSHGGFVYRTPKGTFQLIIADVFVGKVKVCGGGNYVKAPEGYDSVSNGPAGHYILYNNFHSYPLYLIEYR